MQKPNPKDSAATPIDRLLDILQYLRTSPDGCAWTKEQTHKSLVPYLIEESYETAEVIDNGRHDETLAGELGDLLLQIVFHAEIAREAGRFTFDDVAQSIVDKLERRYPTILGDEPNTLKTPAEIDRRWEEIKAEERRKKGIVEKEHSIMDDVSRALPALTRAAKLKNRIAKLGWEWADVSGLLDKISEEVDEVRAEVADIKNGTGDKERLMSEIGDLMFILVDCARWHDIDAEEALRTTCNRFENRVRFMEREIRVRGQDLKETLREERGALWRMAKLAEKESG